MPTISVTDSNNTQRSIEVEAGYTLMEALQDAGFEEILAMCGGSCSCATCHVHIAADQMDRLPPMEETELDLLELADNYQPGHSRLSCQVPLTEAYEGLKVTLFEIE